MKINWLKQYADFASNTAPPWTGMLEHLGEKLGLTAVSLSAYGVGFAPLVQFKKRLSSAWWVIPERNAEGQVVGLSLRSETSDTKVMYPGSKHGLAYVVRTGYKTGTTNYVPGRHNWVRVADAKRVCPVCGKPDGCMVSAENPADPKAVLCIREKKGSARPGSIDEHGGGGHLHLLKPEAHITKGGPLEDSEHPVIIVEGLTDAVAARDLGFVAVGRPSNLAGLGYLRDLVRGRRVWIIGENDRKANGDWPGRTGMEATFESLKDSSRAVKFMPPEEFKDLRQWKNQGGLDQATLLKYAADNGSDRGDDRLLDSAEPYKIAVRWLKEEHTQEGVPILRKYNGEWYRFNGQCYEPVEEESLIRGGLYRWLLDRDVKQEQEDGGIDLVPYSADKSKITNIIDALSDPCPLKAEPPCWLDGRAEPEPKDMIAFPNGVLNVREYLRDGTTDLLPLSPLFFTFNSLPYNFDADATCPLFEKFLLDIFPDDPKKRLLAQEWAGLLLVPDTSFQKLMVFNGTSGSGKGTLLYAIEAMLGGTRQVCSPTLTGFGQPYGLAQMVGKLAAFVKDARLDNSAHKYVIMERLLELSGSVHPMLEVRRMHVAETTMHLFARITIACNDLPDLPDSGGALPRRTLALHFTEKFETDSVKPDRELPDKLAKEAPGILNWALRGLERLRRQGYFTIPQSSEQLAKKFAANASPISQFIDACCEVGSEKAAAEDALYEAWRNWAREHSLGAGLKLKFQHNLMLTVSSVRHVTNVLEGRKVGGYTGIALTQEAKDRYLAK